MAMNPNEASGSR